MENPNSATFRFPDEDDTLGNILRHQLLLNKQVTFAGYVREHPLIESVDVRVQTMSQPVKEVVDEALQTAVSELYDFEKAFHQALAR